MEQDLQSNRMQSFKSKINLIATLGISIINILFGILIQTFVDLNIWTRISIILCFISLYTKYTVAYAEIIQNRRYRKYIICSLCPFICVIVKFIRIIRITSNMWNIITSINVIVLMYTLELNKLLVSGLGLSILYSVTILFTMLCKMILCLLWMNPGCFIKSILIKLSRSNTIEIGDQMERNNHIEFEQGRVERVSEQLNINPDPEVNRPVLNNRIQHSRSSQSLNSESAHNSNHSNKSSKKKEEIEYFKIIKFQQTNVKECIICFDKLEGEKELVELVCNQLHVFHKECAVEWFKEHSNCPLCRKEIKPKDQTSDTIPLPPSILLFLLMNLLDDNDVQVVHIGGNNPQRQSTPNSNSSEPIESLSNDSSDVQSNHEESKSFPESIYNLDPINQDDSLDLPNPSSHPVNQSQLNSSTSSLHPQLPDPSPSIILPVNISIAMPLPSNRN